MSFGIEISETMSGWISFHDDDLRRHFEFSIKAFTPRLFSLMAPRQFTGAAKIAGYDGEIPVKGTLVIRPTGPSYDLLFDLPGKGALRVAGNKTYDLRKLTESLTTCPLLVYKEGAVCGQAEVAYRDSLWSFPFKAIRLGRATV